MNAETESGRGARRSPFKIPMWVGFGLFLAIALFFLWEEHRAHLLGALPFVLVLVFAIVFFLMDRGPGHGRDRSERGGQSQPRHGGGGVP